MQAPPRRRLQHYGQLAFAGVVLACYAQVTFIDLPHVRAQPDQILAVFAMGILYTLLFSFHGTICDNRPPGVRTTYYIAQCVLVIAAIFVSPSRGLFGSLALPLVSQAMFELDWRGAAAVSLCIFVACVGVFYLPFGWSGVWRSLVLYVPIFLFVIMFTLVAMQAMSARAAAERLSGELAEANEKLRAHAVAVEELATVRERNRVAREIHDGVGHYLTVIKVQLDAAAALLPRDPKRAEDSVLKAAGLAADALADVRRSVSALAADSARPLLVDSLRELATLSVPAASLTIEGQPRALGVAAEHALYRTAQEGLTNVRKHAGGASHAAVMLDFRQPRVVRLAVVDDGRGPPARTENASNGGFGLRGLRERLTLMGGTVKAGTQAGGGFRLEVEIPV